VKFGVGPLLRVSLRGEARPLWAFRALHVYPRRGDAVEAALIEVRETRFFTFVRCPFE
jgi:hypothetical protein